MLQSVRFLEELKKSRTALINVLGWFLFALFATTILTLQSHAISSRIKDIVSVQGVRENMLVGYGLVVGLNGTGDDLSSASYTKESLISMLERLGVNTRSKTIDSKNVAAVMVTAALPAFARQGGRIDVTVSALGNAKNLLGGTLLVTPLIGADSQVYAVAQGTIATGGLTASGKAETITKGVPTSGRIANGAIVEKETGFELVQMETLVLSLRNPDFTTAKRIAEVINMHFRQSVAQATDPSSVKLIVPEKERGDMVAFMTAIEQLQVTPDQIAKVVIDDHDGVIVMGSNVKIASVAVSHGSITVRITEAEQVSQPGPFATAGTTEKVDRTKVNIDEGKDKKMIVLDEGVTLQELVNSLNALGASPRDVITILQSIKAAGALQADIEVI